MPYPIANPAWNVTINNKQTFFGVLSKHFDSMCKLHNLGVGTSRGYAGEYENHILPRLNDRPLEAYSVEDFEKVIQDIANSSRKPALSSLRKYRMHIIRVVEMAVEYEGMRDPFWGVTFKGITTIKHARENESTTLPKSMTVLQQCALGREIYLNATDRGDITADMLTYEAGLRNKESAGVSFGDVKDCGNFAVAAIHTSTKGQGHERHGKLKTKNGFRTIVLSNNAKRIIQQRQERVHSLMEIEEGAGGASAIMRAPIAGMTENPRIAHSSVQASKAFRELLRDIGYDQKDYLAATRTVESEDYANAVRKVSPEELGFAAERNPTLYIGRRQYCTDMHIVGCTAEERQYSMGHDIENTTVDRRDFRNDDVLRELATKLLKRPSVNKEVLTRQCHTLSGEAYHNPDFHDECVRLPLRKGKIRIWISSHETSTPVSLKITVPEDVHIKCTYYERDQHSPQRTDANVLNDYYDEFRIAYKLIEEKQQLSQCEGLDSAEEPKDKDE